MALQVALFPFTLMLLPFKNHWYVFPLAVTELVADKVMVVVLQLLNAKVAPSVIIGTGIELNVTLYAELAALLQPVALVTTTV